jgi:transposase
VRITTLFNKLLNFQGLWVLGLNFALGALILRVRPRSRVLTCCRCGHRKRGRFSLRIRRWRHLGIWGQEVWLEGPIRRMRCPRCKAVVTEAVPWARHGSGFTRVFEDTVALLAQKLDKTSVVRLTGISWVTVGSIAERVCKEKLDPDRLKGLRRIGVDEISFRRGHRYVTVVMDHDRRRVVWAAEGKSSEVLKAFFRELAPQDLAKIEIVTMDMSAAYQKAVLEMIPHADIAFDHFHLVKLANDALNEVRRELVREAAPAQRKAIKGTRTALLYRLDRLPAKHEATLATISPRGPLGRAYLLKETFLEILRSPVRIAKPALQRWLSWAQRSRLAPFVKLGNTIRAHIRGVHVFLEERMTNGLVEGMNNKIRLLSHRAYGFHSAAPLIATIYLCCGGITLPELQLV